MARLLRDKDSRDFRRRVAASRELCESIATGRAREGSDRHGCRPRRDRADRPRHRIAGCSSGVRWSVYSGVEPDPTLHSGRGRCETARAGGLQSCSRCRRRFVDGRVEDDRGDGDESWSACEDGRHDEGEAGPAAAVRDPDHGGHRIRGHTSSPSSPTPIRTPRSSSPIRNWFRSMTALDPGLDDGSAGSRSRRLRAWMR